MEQQNEQTPNPKNKRMILIGSILLVLIIAAGATAAMLHRSERGGKYDKQGTEQDEEDMTNTVPQTPTPAPEATSTQSTTTPVTTPASSTKTFTVQGSSFAFSPSEIKVKKGDTVKIIFNNTGGFHDFVIDEFAGARTNQIKGGDSQTISFIADKAGSFEYYCSVGTHRQMGMRGTLVVE